MSQLDRSHASAQYMPGTRRLSMAASGSLDTDAAVSRFMALPRTTLSARPGHRHARGMDAVLLTFDKKVQIALRQLALERLDLDARLRVVLDRLDAMDQKNQREPDVLARLRVQIADNDYQIRRLAKDATPMVMAALREAEVQAATSLSVQTEEEAEEEGGESFARTWRRRLESRHLVTRVDAPYRRITHDSPSIHGDKDIFQKLNSANPEDGLSYFQKATLRYGRGRRGSTSFAGAPLGTESAEAGMLPLAASAE